MINPVPGLMQTDIFTPFSKVASVLVFGLQEET